MGYNMNMGFVKISVIVPMYNVAEYLEECLNSLADQSMNDLEFILINDGSTDNTLEIAKRFKEKDERFKIIDKKNSGYGDSVNVGIAKAKGVYVGIVEPDDFCTRDMFKKLYSLAESYKSEIARGGYYHFSRNGLRRVKSQYMIKTKGLVNPMQEYGFFYEPPAIWSAIYSRRFLVDNGIKLLNTPGASYQDAGFHFKTLACARRMAYIDQPLYYYRVDNPNSSVKDFKKVMAIVREFDSIEKFIEELDDRELLMCYCQVTKFVRYHWNLLRLDKKNSRKFALLMKDEFVKNIKIGIVRKEFFPKKYWISLKALMLLPVNLYLFLLSIKKLIK